jgi:cytoskeletal protein CcmA (bactofilin family)
MFTKKSHSDPDNAGANEAENDANAMDVEDEDREPKSKQEGFSARSVSYMGPGMCVRGEVEVEEGLIIDGVLEGQVTTSDKSLTIGKQGRVSGDIFANAVEVRGKVDGEIYSKELVRLFPSALVEGDIHCNRLVVDEGATFNGRIDMTWDGTIEEEQAPEKVKLTSVDSDESIAKAAG